MIDEIFSKREKQLLALEQKKKRLDSYRPLPSALVRNLDDWFCVELTYTSNALEGNTLSRKETALIVEKGLTVGGKSLIEHLEATNHAKALQWMYAQIARNPSTLQEEDIFSLHSLILQGIDPENAGQYRKVSVRVVGSLVVFPNWAKVAHHMQEFVAWLQEHRGEHPVIFASLAHYKLVTIHPFVDGNGRTARLLMNMLLMMQGYPPAIIRPKDRLNYLESLEKAQLGESQEEYINLIIKALDRSLTLYLEAIENIEKTPQNQAPKHLFKIGVLSKKVGETKATLRYWTAQGLIHAKETTNSGYFLYSEETLHRIERIHQEKKQRKTIAEIKQILIRVFGD